MKNLKLEKLKNQKNKYFKYFNAILSGIIIGTPKNKLEDNVFSFK